jgi:ATP-dependent protease HslVU (ClpYQ) ATPase subunit
MNVAAVVAEAQFVASHLGELATHEDLSRFILQVTHDSY